MVVRRLSDSEASAAVLCSVGLDPSRFAPASVESVAALLRRAAGFACPCTPSAIVGSVVDALRGTEGPAEELLRENVERALDGLLAYGDLLELDDYSYPEPGVTRRLLYAAPPSFVLRDNGSAVIMGIVPDHTSLLPSEIESRIEYVDCLRRVRPCAGEDLRQQLLDAGMKERSRKSWVSGPKAMTAAQFLNHIDQRLAAKPSFGDVPGLTIIDTSIKNDYYRGRWVIPTTQTGRFVGRRTIRYGSPLWCYVATDAGRVVGMLDLPLDIRTGGGCDEAWRLQAALDAHAGAPQWFRRRPAGTGEVALDFFSPLPRWVTRRWLFLARPVERRSSVLSYAFPQDEIDQEVKYLGELLWMEEKSTHT